MTAPSARNLALHVLKEVNEEGAYVNIALDGLLRKNPLPPVERRFLTELVYGTLRTQNTLDWILSQYVQKGLEKLPAWIKNILRLSIYQLFYLDRIPASAAVNEGVKLARKYGHPGTVKLVNGVLRNVTRGLPGPAFPGMEKDPVAHISLKYSHPVWLVRLWLEEYGPEETEALCRANNVIPPNTVRTNTLKTTPAELTRLLEEEGVTVESSAFAPEGLILKDFYALGELTTFKKGFFQVQDESSMLVAPVVSPRPGDFVIDACGAPGGKTTHLAQLMENRGRILSCDIHEHKLALINENCRRLGITVVETFHHDARLLAEDYADKADAVLVDAPCSGLGVIRRRPDIKWRKGPESLAELPPLQKEILEAASRCVKPGGVLVYSTCTITRQENNEVIDDFLTRHGDFVPEDLTPYIPAGLQEEASVKQGFIQLLPHRHGTDGLFIARLRRKGG